MSLSATNHCPSQSQNRSLIRNYMEVKTFGSLRSAKRVIERVNSHRSITTSSSSSSSESRRHHHHQRAYRISHPVDIGTYPLCLDFRTHIDTTTDLATPPITTVSNHHSSTNNPPSATLPSLASSPTLDQDEIETIEIGTARMGRVMRARLCRFHCSNGSKSRRAAAHHRPPTIVDGELQVAAGAGGRWWSDDGKVNVNVAGSPSLVPAPLKMRKVGPPPAAAAAAYVGVVGAGEMWL